MKLLELHLNGFGRLVNRTFRFAPGFNLVVGPNEAGKSTLQRAILAMLYGYFDDGQVTAAKRELLAASMPWDRAAPSYGGWLTYALDDGQPFRVERSFHPKPSTSVLTLPDQKDVTGRYRSASHGRVFFADEQLGMSREVFENICSVRQTELAALEGSANAITDTLMRLSASGSAEGTTAAALAILDQALRDQIGTQRAWTKPLARATKRLTELEDARTQVRRERDELFVKVTELKQVQEDLQRLSVDTQRLDYLRLCAERNRTTEQLGSDVEVAETIAERAAEMVRWEQWASFPAQLRDDVVPLARQREQLKTECADAQARAIQAKQALQPIDEEIVALQARIKALADADNAPIEALSTVQELANRWRRAEETQSATKDRAARASAQVTETRQQMEQRKTTMKPLVSLGFPGLAKLQQQLQDNQRQVTDAERNLQQAQARWAKVGKSESEFQDLERTVQEIQSGARPTPPVRKGCKPFSSSSSQTDQPPTGLVIYSQIRPIYAEMLQRRADVDTARNNLAKTEAATKQRLGVPATTALDDSTFAELEKQLKAYTQAEAALEMQKNASIEAEAELKLDSNALDETALALRGKLGELGYTQRTLAVALDAYLAQCNDKQRLERERASLERQQLHAESWTRDIETYQQRQASLTRTEAQLCALIAEAGIECSSNTLDEALASFLEAVLSHRQWTTAKARYEEAIRQQAMLESVQEKAGMQHQLAELDARLRVLAYQHPEWKGLNASRPPQEYVQQEQQTAERQRSVRDRQMQLRNDINSAADRLRHPAEIDEEIAMVKAEGIRLEAYRDALELARTELLEATQEFQRQFAPKLELQLAESLDRVTAGRYSQAQVDPVTLAVALRTAERNTAVGTDQLSTGTRDLVYLMLRIGIAQIMSRVSEKPPLMLDDALVHCDRDRYLRTLEFLVQLASETQIFLFTKDQWTMEWLGDRTNQTGSHETHVL